MVSLITSFVVLIIGFIVYGKVTEKVFGPNDRKTPAIAINDGVDCVPMATWKAFLVQLLNIAALWGATAYLIKKGKYRFGFLITALPATFMTAVSTTYILMAKEGFRLAQTASCIVGITAAAVLFVRYLIALIQKNRTYKSRM